MKKAFLILLVIFTFRSSAQTEFEYLFPFKIGISKLEAIKTMTLNPNLHYSNSPNDQCKWSTLEDGKDSTYMCCINFISDNNKYFNGFEVYSILSFSDDKLFLIDYYIKYRPDAFNKCLNDFESLKKIIKNKFPYPHELIVANWRNTSERNGEGFLFNNKAQQQTSQSTAEAPNSEITYSLHKETLLSEKIDYYYINIKYKDFRKTKISSTKYTWLPCGVYVLD